MRQAAGSATRGGLCCPTTDARTYLQTLWQDEPVLEELGKLFGPEETRPTSLPTTSQAVARGLQLRILLEELPVLRSQLEQDGELGASTRRSAEFRTEFDRQAMEGNIPERCPQPVAGLPHL